MATKASEALKALLQAAEYRSETTRIELERVQQALEKSQEKVKLFQDLLNFIHGRPPYYIPYDVRLLFAGVGFAFAAY